MGPIPPLQSTGTYQLKAPFDTQIVAGVSYTCVALRKLVDFIHDGLDPYSLFYLPRGLDQTVYAQAQAQGEVIVSLQSTGGQWIHVPSDYILNYPNIGGIRYTALVLGISLGPIPDNLNLSAVKQKIKDVVRDYIGVTSDVQSVAVSESKSVNEQDHLAIETARQQAITTTTTDFARLQAMTVERDALRIRNQKLEAYIAANRPPGTPSP